jgi:hypothetical protein
MKAFNYTVLALLLMTGGAFAQEVAKLSVKGSIVCDKKDKSVMSSVTIYRFYQQSQSVELMEQVMVPRNGNFKFDLAFDQEYILDVASNTGVHKRVNLNTEVMKGYKLENQNFDFMVDVQAGDMDNPKEVAWIYFDPSKNDFSHSEQMPMAFDK